MVALNADQFKELEIQGFLKQGYLPVQVGRRLILVLNKVF